MRFVISFPRRTTIPTILVTASKAFERIAPESELTLSTSVFA
jgi:hypothetical protein